MRIRDTNAVIRDKLQAGILFMNGFFVMFLLHPTWFHAMLGASCTFALYER